MKTNKGSSTVIIIIALIIGLMFLAAASVGGYFAYKYFFQEEDEEEEEEETSFSSKKNNKDDDDDDNNGLVIDNQKTVDCGLSNKTAEDFDDIFFSIDFDQDQAFSCMGKNMKNNCKEAEMKIKIEGTDLVFKNTGTGSYNCKVRIEGQDPKEGLIWGECPVSSLEAFIDENAIQIPSFKDLQEKMALGNGNYGAGIFVIMAGVMSLDDQNFKGLGCSRSN